VRRAVYAGTGMNTFAFPAKYKRKRLETHPINLFGHLFELGDQRERVVVLALIVETGQNLGLKKKKRKERKKQWHQRENAPRKQAPFLT